MLNHKIICQKLQETYNTNVLKQATKETRDLFVATAKTAKEINLNKGNQTLLSLIDNYSKQKTPVPKYIAGPISMSVHWNSQYQLYIYVIGELHDTKTDCRLYREKGQTPSNTMLIEDFLEQLISTTPAFLDIYIEWIKSMKDAYNQGDRLHEIYIKLGECLEYSTRDNTKCELARLHYVDIRQDINSSIYEKINDLSYADIILNSFKITYKFINNNKRLKTILNILNTDSLTKYEDFFRQQIRQNKMVVKELNKSFLGKDIESYFTEVLVGIALNTRKLIRESISVLLNPKSSDEDLRQALIILVPILVEINTSVMDTYTLSRIFKKFDVTKPKAKYQSTTNYQPESPHNIIIYAGQFHCYNYRKFLEYIQSEEIGFAGSRAVIPKDSMIKNCIDISSFPMPFFT